MKKSFLITYDLHSPGQDYETLIEGIKKLGTTWWHCLDSVWIIKSTLTCSVIRDRLGKYIDKNDELLVVELTGSWATSHLSKNCNDWLKNNL